jgi:hypothetical protein
MAEADRFEAGDEGAGRIVLVIPAAARPPSLINVGKVISDSAEGAHG